MVKENFEDKDRKKDEIEGDEEIDDRKKVEIEGDEEIDDRKKVEIEGDEEIDDEKKANNPELKALDGGYGWLVVLGCFLSHVVNGGIERSDGVAYLQFLGRFKQSAQLTAWPGAIMSTMNLCLAPLASAFCSRYSVRTSVMCAGLLISTGCILNGLAPNFYFLFFSHSFLVGVGRGLSYAPGLIIVAMYFDRLRGFATGLGSSGVGVGTFLLAPISQYMFDNLGYQGTYLIFGGIALNINLAAMLYRPLSLHYKFLGLSKHKTRSSHISIAEASIGSEEFLNIQSLKSRNLANDQQNKSKELEDFTNQHNEDDAPKEKDTSDIQTTNCLMSNLKICFPTELRKEREKNTNKFCHLYLMKDPSFLLYCLSVWLFTMATKSAFMFIPALVKYRGCTESQASIVLSVAGAIDALSRIGAGFILETQKLKPYRPMLYNGFMFILACVAFLMPSMESFPSFIAICSVYGMFTGAYISQKSIILVDILGIQHMANSLGIVICFQSFGTLLGPPLSGALKDHFGSFAEALYLGGGFMVTAGLLMVTSNVFLLMSRRKAALQQKYLKPRV